MIRLFHGNFCKCQSAAGCPLTFFHVIIRVRAARASGFSNDANVSRVFSRCVRAYLCGCARAPFRSLTAILG